MRGFRDPERTQKFLSCFGPIRQHFALKRHLLRASLYRKQLVTRFAFSRGFLAALVMPNIVQVARRIVGPKEPPNRQAFGQSAAPLVMVCVRACLRPSVSSA
jgi:putative transposase